MSSYGSACRGGSACDGITLRSCMAHAYGRFDSTRLCAFTRERSGWWSFPLGIFDRGRPIDDRLCILIENDPLDDRLLCVFLYLGSSLCFLNDGSLRSLLIWHGLACTLNLFEPCVYLYGIAFIVYDLALCLFRWHCLVIYMAMADGHAFLIKQGPVLMLNSAFCMDVEPCVLYWVAPCVWQMAISLYV